MIFMRRMRINILTVAHIYINIDMLRLHFGFSI